MRKRWIAMLATGALVATTTAYGAYYYRTTARAEVPAEDFLDIDLVDMEVLPGDWTDNDPLVRDDLHSRSWVGDGGVLGIKVWHTNNQLWADYKYFTGPRRSVKRDQPDHLVREIEGVEVAADRSDLFCANIGRSTSEDLEDCHHWGYWARYGQYVVFLDLFLIRMPVDDFVEMAIRFDAHVDAVAPRV